MIGLQSPPNKAQRYKETSRKENILKEKFGVNLEKAFFPRLANIEYLKTSLIKLITKTKPTMELIQIAHVLVLANLQESHHILVEIFEELLHSLRIPRQVVVHNERTKLQVDSFGSCLGGYHNLRLLTEIIHDGLTLVG